LAVIRHSTLKPEKFQAFNSNQKSNYGLMKKSNLFSFTLLLASISALLLSFTDISSDVTYVEGNHDVITQSRPLSASFSEIKVKGSYIVTVTPFSRDSIVLEAESNILPNVLTDIADNRLVIHSAENLSFKTHAPVKVHVFARNITLLDLSGSGSIDAENIANTSITLNLSGSGKIKSQLKVEKLKALVSGSGDIEVWGTAGNSELSVSGSGNIKSFMLSQQKCSAAITGSGNINLSAEQSLEAKISGSGSVFYKGKPKVNSHIIGSGKIRPA
jgi:hypothetical protein